MGKGTLPVKPAHFRGDIHVFAKIRGDVDATLSSCVPSLATPTVRDVYSACNTAASGAVFRVRAHLWRGDGTHFVCRSRVSSRQEAHAGEGARLRSELLTAQQATTAAQAAAAEATAAAAAASEALRARQVERPAAANAVAPPRTPQVPQSVTAC